MKQITGKENKRKTGKNWKENLRSWKEKWRWTQKTKHYFYTKRKHPQKKSKSTHRGERENKINSNTTKDTVIWKWKDNIIISLNGSKCKKKKTQNQNLIKKCKKIWNQQM